MNKLINKDLKISLLLKNYPGAINVLLKASPHFQKLQNKLLRKTLAGRVTIEQAASIAGVDLENLLSELRNLDAGINKNEMPESGIDVQHERSDLHNEKPAYLKLLNDESIITLDVRPILNSGKDPLNDILNEIKKIKIGGALHIINSFEPIPLYSLLGKKGYSHWSEFKNNCWNVYFYTAEDKPRQSIESARKISIDVKDFENVIELDVRDLPAPEPMIKILENLNRVDDKSVMLVYHHREPNLLYPKLEERGYEAVCNKLDQDKYQVLIAKKRSS